MNASKHNDEHDQAREEIRTVGEASDAESNSLSRLRRFIVRSFMSPSSRMLRGRIWVPGTLIAFVPARAQMVHILST